MQNRVKLTSIKWWLSQWKLGKHLPRCAKKERPPKPGTGDVEYREFWEPIRREGLFAGSGNVGAWITKSFRGIALSLVVHNHACSVDLQFYRDDRKERRNKALKLLPTEKYRYELRESPKCAYVRFPVFDKGIKDREHWPEIREQLTRLGADIYTTLNNSDV